MASTSNGHKGEEELDDDLPTSHLTRPSPDAILADEADETTLLGNESDSEGGGSRRNSTLSASEGRRQSKRISQVITMTSDPAKDETPTQSSFPSKRSSVVPIAPPVVVKAAQNETELRTQIEDLVNQVTGLNSKLVNSFMRISDLEDDLSDTQEKLTGYQVNVASLEKERQEHLAALNTGLLVEKAHVSSEMQKMMERVIEETAQRGQAISDKEKIEAELDELSSSLFSEANKMVAVERLARARAEEKSSSMEERLRNTEELMEQQQKRLVELQSEVEQADKEKLAPKQDAKNGSESVGDKQEVSTSIGGPSVLSLAEEQVKLDIVPYTELRAFLNHLRKLRAQLAPFYNYPLPGAGASAANSVLASPNGSRSNSPAPGQARVTSQTFQHSGLPGPYGHSSQSGLSPFIVAGVSRHKDFPSLPANVEQMIHLPSQISSMGFLKRINEEDCEPCLRLDFAPGLNWLSRRQMQTAILEGNLLIEPVFGGGIYDEGEVRNRALGSPPAACAMCGKIVVNVPMPGGTSTTESNTWISAAGNAAIGAVTSSLPSRDQSVSPPLGSGQFFNTSSNSTNQHPTLTSKKSSTGLFSTLRSMGGSSPRPSMSPNPSSSNFTNQTQSESTTFGVEEDQFANRLPPIPTHIFRINETSNSRYLLCPSYCLQRLRVTCDFWGYIRHLERAVVLEGKLAWDEDQQRATPGKDTLPPNVPEKETATIHEVEAGAAETATNVDDGVDDTIDAEESATPTEAKKDGGGKNNGDEADGKANTDRRLSTTDDSLTDGEDGFADAKSVASSPVRRRQSLADDITQLSTEVNDEQEKGDDAEKATDVAPTIAPPPQRPIPTPKPPALPPRRSSQGQIRTGPEPRKMIPSKGDIKLTWEEKVWLEVLRHKADMWSARVGLEK